MRKKLILQEEPPEPRSLGPSAGFHREPFRPLGVLPTIAVGQPLVAADVPKERDAQPETDAATVP